LRVSPDLSNRTGGESGRRVSRLEALNATTCTDTFSGVEWETSSERPRCGHCDATARNPSPVRDIAQWCLPSRRQHAGVGLGSACRKGEAKPRSANTSSKLADARRISRGIVLHHNGLRLGTSSSHARPERLAARSHVTIKAGETLCAT